MKPESDNNTVFLYVCVFLSALYAVFLFAFFTLRGTVSENIIETIFSVSEKYLYLTTIIKVFRYKT